MVHPYLQVNRIYYHQRVLAAQGQVCFHIWKCSVGFFGIRFSCVISHLLSDSRYNSWNQRWGRFILCVTSTPLVLFALSFKSLMASLFFLVIVFFTLFRASYMRFSVVTKWLSQIQLDHSCPPLLLSLQLELQSLWLLLFLSCLNLFLFLPLPHFPLAFCWAYGVSVWRHLKICFCHCKLFQR